MIGLPLLRGGPFLFQTRSVWASGCNDLSAHRSFVNISGNPFHGSRGWRAESRGRFQRQVRGVCKTCAFARHKVVSWAGRHG